MARGLSTQRDTRDLKPATVSNLCCKLKIFLEETFLNGDHITWTHGRVHICITVYNVAVHLARDQNAACICPTIEAACNCDSLLNSHAIDIAKLTA